MMTFESSFTNKIRLKYKADKPVLDKCIKYIVMSKKWFENSTFNATLMHRLQQKSNNIGTYQYSEHEAVLLLSI